MKYDCKKTYDYYKKKLDAIMPDWMKVNCDNIDLNKYKINRIYYDKIGFFKWQLTIELEYLYKHEGFSVHNLYKTKRTAKKKLMEYVELYDIPESKIGSIWQRMAVNIKRNVLSKL